MRLGETPEGKKKHCVTRLAHILLKSTLFLSRIESFGPAKIRAPRRFFELTSM